MKLKISRILHAGYVFEHQGIQIAFDPLFENPFSVNCYAYPNVKFNHEQIRQLNWSAVFISHYHDDHCSLESLNELPRTTPIYIFCLFEELLEMIRQLGFTQVIPLNLDEPVHVGPFEIIPQRALEADVDSFFHIKVDGLNILNVVDSWIEPTTLIKLSRTPTWDMVLWPFQTMRELEVLTPTRAQPPPLGLPIEWAEPLKILNPKWIVPSSCQFIHEDWSWRNEALFPISYEKFEREIKLLLPLTTVIRLHPSTSVFLDSTSLTQSSPLTWVQPVGPQNLDYQFRFEKQATPTSEIAKHFPALNSEQLNKVHDFCNHQLIEKYNSLEISETSYFSSPRCWRLSLYDHLGQQTDFYYNLKPGFAVLTSKMSTLSWCTEIPSCKLLSAIEEGETLTSIYIRMNETQFEPSIEQEIAAADLVEDPLLRCLFDGVFGAYQKAQLKRLQARQN